MMVDFKQRKSMVQAEFDQVMGAYPSDLSGIIEKIPYGGDAYERKAILMRTMAKECPIHIFPHYPFAFEMDYGQPRDHAFFSIGQTCCNKSGVDFTPLENLRELYSVRNNLGGFNNYTDIQHRTINHKRLLEKGYSGVYEECLELNENETDPLKKKDRELIMEACKAMQIVGERFRCLAARMLAETEDEEVRNNLKRIAESPNTPWEKPETMYDALNSILCAIHMTTGLDGLMANMLGRLDQVLYPFYKKDLEAGRITEEEAYNLLQYFLYRADGRILKDYGGSDYTVCIGGYDRDGQQVYNDITKMIIRAYRENRYVSAKLNARCGVNSSQEYMEELIGNLMAGCNNMVLLNDGWIVPMFGRMGIAEEDARDYVGGGCQEVICMNQVHGRACYSFNLPQVLLDTLKYIKGDTPMTEDHQRIYKKGQFVADSFSQLYESYLMNLRSAILTMTETLFPFQAIHNTINPEPVLSALMDDCVAKGQDITRGGARYYNDTLSFVGFGTLCDSLLSLKMAYENGTIEELLRATKANFEGYESLLANVKKNRMRFGHFEEADMFAHDLAQDLTKVTVGIKNARGNEYGTSLFTFNSYIYWGMQTEATPDGRQSGETLSRQMNMAVLPDLTTAARSLANICSAPFCDVSMFDLALQAKEGEEYLRTITEYVKTCLQLKIPALQINILNRDMLTEEYEHPGTHQGMVVRICGYSARFDEVSKEFQEEIIARME